MFSYKCPNYVLQKMRIKYFSLQLLSKCVCFSSFGLVLKPVASVESETGKRTPDVCVLSDLVCCESGWVHI